MVEEANEGLSKAQKHRRRRRDICDHRAFLQGLLEEAHGFVWPSSEELGGLGVCKAQGAEGQGAKHLQKARQFLEHRLHAAVIKLEEEQHKQAIAHDDEQAKGALVDKEGPDHSGCDSGQSRKSRKTAMSSDFNWLDTPTSVRNPSLKLTFLAPENGWLEYHIYSFCFLKSWERFVFFLHVGWASWCFFSNGRGEKPSKPSLKLT